MISTLGQSLVLASLFFSAVGSAAAFQAGRNGSESGYKLARTFAYLFAGSIVMANFVMVYALVTHDFSVGYVAEVGSKSTPLYFTIVSLWASLNGSILFWGGILGLYTGGFLLSMGNNHREYMPWTLHVQLGIAVFFTLLIATIADPFAAVANPLPDGPGPNPLLQNHWLMAIHPPTLYLGYVGMVGPYSMICGALLAGRVEAGWMRPIRNWMLIPWSWLSLGIVLGGWWSYAVLGWGGAWAWDPVENASFHPWLTGTAFLHSAMVLERRGRMRDWTLILGMTTFLLTLVGTFMTRSGVFNSVHSFTQSDIGPVFLYFIGFILVYSVLLLAFRSGALDEASKENQRNLGTQAPTLTHGASLLSREAAILAQNAVFAIFTFLVLQGTLWPLVLEAAQDRRVSVGEPYFDRVALPLGILLVFLMGVGPALPWGRMRTEDALPRFMGPVIGGGVLAGVVALAGYHGPYSLLAMFVIGFAATANMGELITPIRARMEAKKEGVAGATQAVLTRTRRRFGGHVAHYGVLLAVFSLAMTKGYRTETEFSVSPGDVSEFNGYTLRYVGSEEVQEEHRRSMLATFDVHSGDRSIGLLSPRMNYYSSMREPVFSPDVYSNPMGDLYLSLIELSGDQAVYRVIYQPYQMWMWWSGPVIMFGTLIAIWPARRRRRGGELPANPEQASA
ncbi:MAG: heme lyase CcmF/NrfE family subunit [Rhodobacterales bacterium]|nr:heme lyase CcmF/NrfE family subunit [Rhodobacterales bacterium]